MPALVSTLCICIVFVPMFLLGGVARYLFVPLAEAVVFAMLASYVLSRTLVPTMAMYLLRAKPHDSAPSRNPLVLRRNAASSGISSDARLGYRGAAERHRATPRAVHSRSSCCAALRSSRWCRGWARTSFPNTDSGQFILHMRAKTGTRIEETARLADLVEASIRKIIPPRDLDTSSTTSACPTAPSISATPRLA